MELSDVFTAKPQSVFHVLAEQGEGLYLPPYQREYAWKAENVERLFSDITAGLRQLVTAEDAITFIGSLITISDKNASAVAPKVEGDLPPKVSLVIDGQQRLTTLLMLTAALHDKLRMGMAELGDSTPASEWLTQQTQELLPRLALTFEDDRAWGEGDYRFYPRMIRAYRDCWSRKQKTAVYASPLPRFLHAYIRHYRSGVEVPFGAQFAATEVAVEKAFHVNLEKIFEVLEDLALGKATDEDDEPIALPPLFECLSSEQIRAALFGGVVPDAVRQELLAAAAGLTAKSAIASQYRVVLFARYLLDRVAVTIIASKSDAYAFDMFEALNTTGEPLTAFETFRPRVIEFEGLDRFETTEARAHLLVVEELLAEYSRAEERQKATSRLLVPFALAEDGTKESNRLSAQRRFLRDRFSSYSDQEKRSFVRHLSETAGMLRMLAPDRPPTSAIPLLAHIPGLEDVDVVCLDVLRRARHTIPYALLTRMYSQWCRAPESEKEWAAGELSGVIKAVAAFFGLWRGSRRGTANIDSHHRAIMAGAEYPFGGGLSRTRLQGAPLEANTVKGLLRGILEGKGQGLGQIAGKEDWVTRAARLPVYAQSQPLARFLLFAGTHDSVCDSVDAGLLDHGKSGQQPMLVFSQWMNDYEVEHVAPRSPLAGHDWPTDVFADKETIHRLGNLTLLPSVPNATLSNRNWSMKKEMFSALAAESRAGFDAWLEGAGQAGVAIDPETADRLWMTHALPHVKAIAQVHGAWDFALIEKRSQRMAALAWDRLSGWLGYGTKA